MDCCTTLIKILVNEKKFLNFDLEPIFLYNLKSVMATAFINANYECIECTMINV